MPQFDNIIAPSVEGEFVELSRTRSGRVFRKHILNKGPLIHPVTKTKLNVDDDFVDALLDNFNTGVVDHVQIPKAGPKNEHTEDPDRNVGEVIGLEVDGDKVFALLDVRTEDADKLGKTLLGISASMSLDYTDTRTGKHVGPTLLHTCITNRPYVLDLDDFQELVNLSADLVGETAVMVADSTDIETVASAEEREMDKDTLIAILKDQYSIDVVGLQTAVESQAALSSVLASALTSSGVVQLSAGSAASEEDILQAVIGLATNNVELTAKVTELENETLRKSAEVRVDDLVRDGKILPAVRDAMVELNLTNAALFDQLIPAESVVNLSQEVGSEEGNDSGTELDADKELERLVAVAKDKGHVR